MYEKGYLQQDQEVNFYTKSGLLKARKDHGYIQLDFPATPEEEVIAPMGLIDALNITPVYIGKNIFDYIIEVESEEIVKSITPDFTKLMRIPMRGVIVTAKSTEYDFVSRFFAPEVGIFEDPVTGSAHCCLGVYWKKNLGKVNLLHTKHLKEAEY